MMLYIIMVQQEHVKCLYYWKVLLKYVNSHVKQCVKGREQHVYP